ncbi:DUF6850 family outer membrane beta-barrel protein [uncultured Alistipes sp.]|uniref:DUF6850 family outer membrane beta-barrel protein n=1 Tax=uncultured Alistipes sp. TaxID=538949 RepID=UPI00320A2085
MRRFFRNVVCATLVAGGAAGSAPAQPSADVSWRTLRDAELSLGWLRSENAAGLLFFRDSSLSEIAAYAAAEHGGLKEYYEAEDRLAFGLDAASYHRLSERVVVRGEVEYERQLGRRMSGSYFIDPTQTPFDLVEFTDENPGDKQLETYRVAGSVGVAATRRLAVGVRFDYATANYAKRRDLRHVNSLMDMTVSPGILFRTGRFALGVNYTYRRRIESLMLNVYGKTDRVYVSLIDYGAFFGKREVFGDTGYTKQNETKPLFDEYHGGAVQASWRIASRLTLYGELSFRLRSGYYGKPSPTTVVYTNHDGRVLACDASLDYDAGRHRHTLQVTFGQNSVDNRENIYTYRNEEVGRSYIVYLGETEVGSRTRSFVSATYTGRLGMERELPRWRIVCDGGIDSRRITASNYPDYRRQHLTWWHVGTAGERNLLRGRNCWSLRLGAGWSAGQGDPAQDGRYESANESETLTRTRDDLLRREYEFLTAPRLDLSADLRLTRRFGSRGLRGYVAAGYAWERAFGTQYLGDAMRHAALLRVGCEF